MNVCNICKEVHRVRVLCVHVYVSVFNFLRWNKIIKYKKKLRNTYLRQNTERRFASSPLLSQQTFVCN